jgi:hypothetical protein
LNYPHLSIPQRVNLIKSYSNYVLDPPLSLAPLLKYLDSHKDEPAQVKLAALEVLTMTGQPKNEKAEELALALLEQNDSAFRVAVIGAIGNGRLTKAAGRLNELVGDANRPAAERFMAIKALRALDNKGESPRLKDAALKVCKEIVRADEDSGALQAEALRTLATLDPAVGRELAGELLRNMKRAEKRRPRTVGDVRELHNEAVMILGSQPEGAKLVAELFLAGTLPRELLPQVSEALRKHASKHPELAKLMLEVNKPEGK